MTSLKFLPPCSVFVLLSAGYLFADAEPLSLLSSLDESALSAAKTREAAVQVVDEAGTRAVKLNFDAGKYPDVSFSSPTGPWDLSAYGQVSAEVTNMGGKPVKVVVRVDNPGPVAEKRWNTSGATLNPGQTESITVEFGSEKARKEFPLVPSEISAIHVFVVNAASPSTILLRGLTASGTPAAAGPGVGAAKSVPPSAPELIRFDSADESLIPKTTNLGSQSEIVDGPKGRMLKVTLGVEKPYPNVILFPKAGMWNLSPYTRLEVDMVNLDDESIQVIARLDSPGATPKTRCNGGKLALDPGESGTLVINFDREFAAELRSKLIGMQKSPWGARPGRAGMIDAAQLENLNIYMSRPARPQTFGILAVRAAGEFDPASLKVPEPFFPFIDRYGQYRHSDWLNKTKSDDDLARVRKEEEASMGDFPRPAGWNIYGGWADGPLLEKKGHFYTAKHDGKWYLVDPEGRLFFSLGMDVVQVAKGGTPIDEREGWFVEAPWEQGEEFKAFVSVPKKTARGDYKGKTPRLFNFYAANLLRKYGPNWREQWQTLMPRRLMNWGFNTIGNWSDPEILKQGKIPYTHWIFLQSKKLPWQANTRNPVPDPFDPGFEPEVRKAAQRMTAGTTDDPFCIGYFVDNELSWQDEETQGKAAMAGGAQNAAKKELVNDLRSQYGEIARLNEAWGTSFASWESMVEAKDLPKSKEGWEDLKKFSARLARTYFGTIQKVLREVAPKKLYLGCRFADHNPQVVAIAAEFCDVVSFNIYRQKVAAWKPAAPIDKPVIIGEFHFGANDRGVFGSGLVQADSAADRAKKFETYISGAARNPILVGAHWFALVDEPTTGRANDEENHGFGFLSITDTPYQEMIDASRRAAGTIYSLRSGGKQ